MASSSSGLHEPEELLSPATVERHRAIVSLMEELEAVDWYDQRIDATRDEALREILRHNRDEEMEHASMLLEWLRRNGENWDLQLRTHLFGEGPIHEEGEAAPKAGGTGSLDVGSLRGEGGKESL